MESAHIDSPQERYLHWALKYRRNQAISETQDFNWIQCLAVANKDVESNFKFRTSYIPFYSGIHIGKGTSKPGQSVRQGLIFLSLSTSLME